MLQWRGGMLDISRHFFNKDFIKKTLSAMALFDYNVLHLHLTDDQGWRFESKVYPRLHEVGSRRRHSQTSHSLAPKTFDGLEHSGYLSQADIRELVAHAHSLGMEIVPEINIPGHTGALLAAYPQFGINQEVVEVSGEWGISNSLLRPFPETFEFLENIFQELSTLFPSQYIHVGGDESLIDNWLKDDAVLNFMRANNLQSPKEVFNFFMHKVAEILNRLGKKMVTWDDAFSFDPDQATQATVMSWRGNEIGKKAMAYGRDVIQTPVIPTYFDYSQELSSDEPLAIGGPITLDDVLQFEPLPGVLGVQFQLWSEYIQSPAHAEYMMWPRAAALAFKAWSTQNDFTQYFEERRGKLLELGVTIREIDPNKRVNISSLAIGPYHPGYPIHEMMQSLEDAAASGVVFHDADSAH